MKRQITAEEVRALFDYSPEDGHLRWKKRKFSRRPGEIAGSVGKNGYRIVVIQTNYRAKAYLAHRLIWLWAYGEWPPDMLDHINMDKDDNRLANLRLATMSGNKSNQRIRKDSQTGYKGVLAKGKGWSARIQKDGVVYYLGTFPTREQAHTVYCDAAQSLHGKFARGA